MTNRNDACTGQANLGSYLCEQRWQCQHYHAWVKSSENKGARVSPATQLEPCPYFVNQYQEESKP